MLKTVSTDQAPAAFGPYSQAIDTGNMLFVSGQLGIDPKTGEMPGDFDRQAKLVMQNLDAILTQAGYSFKDVVKTTIFLDDLANFAAVNDIYGTYFTEHKPARACFQVAGIPKGAKVEIEMIAVKSV
ncbi:MAG: RidA family protein [Peptococcaceae bacterium]|nr:RidA family protein [Peptococcaceae bacterium]